MTRPPSRRRWELRRIKRHAISRTLLNPSSAKKLPSFAAAIIRDIRIVGRSLWTGKCRDSLDASGGIVLNNPVMGDSSFQNNVPDPLLSGKELPTFKFELEKSKGKVLGN